MLTQFITNPLIQKACTPGMHNRFAEAARNQITLLDGVANSW
jgi:hypothetical protein